MKISYASHSVAEVQWLTAIETERSLTNFELNFFYLHLLFALDRMRSRATQWNDKATPIFILVLFRVFFIVSRAHLLFLCNCFSNDRKREHEFR